MTKGTKKTLQVIGITAAALALTATTSTAAHAVGPPIYVGCTATGASGMLRVIQITNDGPGSKFEIKMEITDTKADGHHARMRFLSKEGNGNTQYWPWRLNTSGVGTIIVNTTAQNNDGGIFRMGVQVARGEGSQILNSCTDWE